MNRKDITPAMLSEFLLYNPIDGHIYKIKYCGGKTTGNYPERAGYIVNKNKPYRQFRIFGHKFKEHIIAWALYYKEFPTKSIDHKNGIKYDNRIENLRLATDQQNVFNSKPRITNKLGFKGVYIRSDTNKYRTTITLNGRRIQLGDFNCPYEAACVRMAAEIELYGEYAYDHNLQIS